MRGAPCAARNVLSNARGTESAGCGRAWNSKLEQGTRAEIGGANLR